ncbi:MAG: hypothetical protein R2737_04820 [Candidatus Nanopelagicales bacterium]
MTRPRQLADPFVVAPPKGVRTRTRIPVTDDEAARLDQIGQFLGSRYRADLVERVMLGAVKDPERARRKKTLTVDTSSRWAGAITRTTEDQYRLAMRALRDEVATLTSATATIRARLAVTPGASNSLSGRARVSGYRDQAERFAKSRRLTVLQARLDRARQRLADGRPVIVVGGKRLWRNRHHLDRARMTEQQWRAAWTAERSFLTADGETGKRHGNETIRVTPDGTLTLKVPAALAPTLGTHLTVTAPVNLDVHRGGEWTDRITAHQAVRYDITHDPGKNRWYLDASWSYPDIPVPPLQALRARRTLAVDLNGDHLAAWAVDPSGNPLGDPVTVPLDLAGLPRSTRDAHLRHAVSTLLRHAEAHGCASLSVENLNFADARTTGRETMGRGRRGKRFRRTVAGIPTAQFRDRLAAMAATAGLWIVAVDPAYTSRWGKQHWLQALTTHSSDATGHHAAAVAIGRRAQAHPIRRKPARPRHGQRTVPGQPAGQSEKATRARTRGRTPAPRAHPRRPGPGDEPCRGAPNTVRGATGQESLPLTT